MEELLDYIILLYEGFVTEDEYNKQLDKLFLNDPENDDLLYLEWETDPGQAFIYVRTHMDYKNLDLEQFGSILMRETFYEKVNQCSEEEGDEILAEWEVCYTMDNEHSKIVKTMRNAIKNGNLDVVKKLLGSNGGLLTVPKYSIWFMAAYCCLIWKNRYCELPY